MTNKDNTNITKTLGQLKEIVQWFDDQKEVDVEQGLLKVKEAAKLIQSSKTRLAEIENDFKEIENEIRQEIGATPAKETKKAKQEGVAPAAVEYPAEDINPDEIPF